MNETLKAAGHIGAELAAAKADLQREMERHRKTWRQLEQVTGLLRECAGQIDLLIEVYVEDDVEPEDIAISEQIKADIHAALSQQAEPAPAQDEVTDEMAVAAVAEFERHDGAFEWCVRSVIRAALATRPAQTEQQPEQQPEQSVLIGARQLAANRLDRLGLNQPPHTKEYHEARDWAEEAFIALRDYRAAQAAPQPEQSGLVAVAEINRECIGDLRLIKRTALESMPDGTKLYAALPATPSPATVPNNE